MAAAVLRRVRVNVRPEGGSATGAFEMSVGAVGGNAGGLTPKDTAKTGVHAASAAGKNGARPRRGITSKQAHEQQISQKGRQSSCVARVRENREKSGGVQGNPPKTALSGRGTSPPKSIPGTGEKRCVGRRH